MGNSEAKKILRRMALDAKNRLINGNYSQDEALTQKKKIARENNLRLIAENESKKPEVTIKLLDSLDEDSLFVKKVEKLVDEDSVTPFKELVDYDVFNELDDVEKQRYIFNLSDRFNKVKKQYLQQKAVNL